MITEYIKHQREKEKELAIFWVVTSSLIVGMMALAAWVMR